MNSKQVNTVTLLKSSIWYTISNFLTRAMVFITTPLFTRLLSKEEYGNFNVFASWQAILLIICGLEIYTTINRARFDYKDEQEFNDYISSCLNLCTCITGVLFIVYLIFPDLFYRVLLLDRNYVYALFAYLFTYPAFAMFQAKQRIEYKYKLSAAISFILVISSSLLAVALAILFEDDRLWGRVLGQYILYVIVGSYMYVYFERKGHKVKLEYWEYAVKMGIPLVFGFLGSQILLTSDAIIVKHLSTAAAVSYISIAHTCSHIILIFVQTLNNAWAPWFYDKLHIDEKSTIRKTYRIYMWFVVFCTMGVLLIGPELVAILGGAKYRDTIYLLPPTFMCGITTVITAQFVNLETYHKKTRYAAILTGIVAVLNIVLAVIGVQLWNYVAACYATVICQLVLIALHYYVVRKMDIKSLLPLRDLLTVLAVSLLLIPTMLLLYQNQIVRYAFVAALGITALTVSFIKRQTIIELISKFRKQK